MGAASILVRPLAGDEGDFPEQVLRALPEWFGIEEATRMYIRDAARLPTLVAEADGRGAGLVTLRTHFPRAAEVHLIAVLPEFHGHGVGRALVEASERLLRGQGVRYLQVKTLGPSRACEHYDRTRRFYEAVGFEPLEEFMTLWPGNPALQMVKVLA